VKLKILLLLLKVFFCRGRGVGVKFARGSDGSHPPPKSCKSYMSWLRCSLTSRRPTYSSAKMRRLATSHRTFWAISHTLGHITAPQAAPHTIAQCRHKHASE